SHRCELRTDSSVESCRHGRIAVAVSRGNNSAITRTGRLGEVFDHRFVRFHQTRTTGNARDRKQEPGTRSCSGEAADRYADRDRLLSAWRDSAVRPATIAGEVSYAEQVS